MKKRYKIPIIVGGIILGATFIIGLINSCYQNYKQVNAISYESKGIYVPQYQDIVNFDDFNNDYVIDHNPTENTGRGSGPNDYIIYRGDFRVIETLDKPYNFLDIKWYVRNVDSTTHLPINYEIEHIDIFYQVGSQQQYRRSIYHDYYGYNITKGLTINSMDIQTIGNNFEIVNEQALFDLLFQKSTQYSGPISFTLDDQINYNYPLGFNNDSLFVPKEGSDLTYRVKVFEGLFESGGELWDQIYVMYYDGIAMRYKSDDDYPLVGYHCWRFSDIEYVKSWQQGSTTIVCKNVQNQVNDDNSTFYYQITGNRWVSQNYRYLNIYQNNSKQNLTNSLSKFNSAVLDTPYFGVNENNGDIGLGNAFSLFAQAFTSISSILGISILPGITLGLLLFLPLIAGMIIFIVWIIKR